VQDPLAKQILEGKVLPGDVIRIDASGGEMKFERVPADKPREKEPAAAAARTGSRKG
jgi:DNA helicase TIP49 (TBP-interacting protein)